MFDKSKIISSLIFSSSRFLFIRILGIIANFVLLAMISRTYGALGLGLYTSAFVCFEIISLISRLGIDIVFLKYISAFSLKKNGFFIVKFLYKKLFLLIMFFSTIACLIFLTFSEIIAVNIFKDSNIIYFLKVASIGIVPYSIIQFHSRGLQGLNQTTIFSFLTAASIPIFSIIGLQTLNSIYPEPISSVLAKTAAIFLTAIFSIIFYYKKINVLPKNQLSIVEDKYKKNFKDIFDLGIPLFMVGGFSFLLNQLDTLMIASMANFSDVGYYNVAVRIAANINIFYFAVNSIVAPRFASLWEKKDYIMLKKTVKDSTKIVFLPTIFTVIPIFIFRHYILNFFGEDFSNSLVSLNILLIANLITAFFGSINVLLNMTDSQSLVMKNIGISLLINIFLNFLLIPMYGIEGAAISSLISTIFWNFSAGFQVYKKFGFTTFITFR